MAPKSSVLQRTADLIDREYENLGLDGGWRFLYSSQSTYQPHTRIALLTELPLGIPDGIERVASSENGNALRTGKFDLQGSVVQREVEVLFRRIAAAIGRPEAWEDLLDQTFTAPACPFHLQSEAVLERSPAIRKACRCVWSAVLSRLRPRVAIILGPGPIRPMHEAMVDAMYGSVDGADIAELDGEICDEIRFYLPFHRDMFMYRLPDLGTHPCLCKSECANGLDRLAARIADALDTDG